MDKCTYTEVMERNKCMFSISSLLVYVTIKTSYLVFIFLRSSNPISGMYVWNKKLSSTCSNRPTRFTDFHIFSFKKSDPSTRFVERMRAIVYGIAAHKKMCWII